MADQLIDSRAPLEPIEAERHRSTDASFGKIQRTLGRGNKPLFVEDPDRRFRLNRPVDDWPDIDTTGLAPLAVPATPPVEAVPAINALQQAASGSDPDAFERAVCAMFEFFGFATVRSGVTALPDSMPTKRCSTYSYSVSEAAKYRDTSSLMAS